MKRGHYLFVLFLILIPVKATLARSNDLRGIEESNKGVISLVEQVMPAVVSLSPPKAALLMHSTDPEKEKGPSPSPPGSGSGVIIDKRGFIVTNNHVVGEAEEIEVTLSDKRTFTGKVVGKDPDTDLAVVKIDSETDFPFVSLGDSKKVKVGQWVMAIGSPFGLDRTVTIGIVSALEREKVNLSRYENFIQTDAAINPGNSGGPLFNLYGEVIGINTAIINVAQGIGFAIPSNMTRTVTEQLIANGKVIRGWLGVGIQPLTKELAEKMGLKEKEIKGRTGLSEPNGVLVNEVFEGNPAFLGGILSGDIIQKVEGESVNTTNALARIIAGFPPKQTVAIDLIRAGKKQQLLVALGEKQADMEVALLPKKPERFFGLTLLDVTSEQIEKFNLKDEKGKSSTMGVVVTEVEGGSPAELEGLKVGDLIKEVEGKPAVNIESFKKIIEEAGKMKTVLLRVSRENRAFFVVLKHTLAGGHE
ncbi:MAG: Do family serine endopeptidase [Nitrospirota bacterium]